jgi:hypothetical protein
MRHALAAGRSDRKRWIKLEHHGMTLQSQTVTPEAIRAKPVQAPPSAQL